MKRLLAVVCLLSPLGSLAQVGVKVEVVLPTITFQAPPALVVVEPGVQVVEDVDDEVFFVDGFYWCRRDGRWFHTRTHRGAWVVVEDRGVPVTLVRLPPGKYKKWKKVKVEAHRGKKKGKGKKGDD